MFYNPLQLDWHRRGGIRWGFFVYIFFFCLESQAINFQNILTVWGGGGGGGGGSWNSPGIV